MSKTKKVTVSERLQSYLRGLSRKRSDRVVTADDAQDFLRKQGFRGGVTGRVSVINSTLRTPSFKSVGSRPSSRPAARYRRITEWVAA